MSGFQSGVPIRPSTFKLLPRRAQIGLSVPLLGGVSGVHGRGGSITGRGLRIWAPVTPVGGTTNSSL